MMLRAIAPIVIAVGLNAIGAHAAFAVGFIDAQCVFNADKSKMSLVVTNGFDESMRCTSSCTYKVRSERLFKPFTCSYSLAGNEQDKVACELPGDGPGSFVDVRPTETRCR